MLDQLRFSLRTVIRGLRRHPAFAVAAVLTLALGIGLNAAVFSAMNAVLLRPLPYADADRLVVLEETRRGSRISVAYLNLLDWRERSRTMASIAGFVGLRMNLTGEGEPERLRVQMVTANLFSTLGVSPAEGRTFVEAEDVRGTAPVAIIGHGLWQRRFGGASGTIGSTIVLDEVAHTIVGIMPAGFEFPGGIVYGPSDVWLPTGLAPAEWDNRGAHAGTIAIGRLAPGQSADAANQEIAAIANQLRQEHPATNEDLSAVATPALDHLVGDSRQELLLLFGAAALVLLVATANVANLLLVRAAGRRQEMVIRAALGAHRGRLAGDLILESVLLTVLGAGIGLAGAALAMRVSAPLLTSLPRQGITVLDWRVIAFAGMAALVTAVLVGALPLLSRGEGASLGALRTRTGGPGGVKTRGWIVSAEAALALMLLIGATLMGRSLARLLAESGGIDPEGVVTWEVGLPQNRYSTLESQRQFHEELLAVLAQVPGVTAAGGITTLPFSGAGAQTTFTLPGSDRDPVRTDVSRVTPGYFAAMGVPLLRGRLLDATDREGAPPVAVVDERFAEQMWPGEDPIGKVVQGWGFEALPVVGVVGHVKNYGVQAESRGELYVAFALRPASRMVGAIRTAGPTSALTRTIPEAIAALDPLLPVVNLRTMQEVVAGTTSSSRLMALLGGVFAVLALALAVVGLYGVLAHGVTLRTKEIGVRLALGADPRRVLRMVLGDALRMVGVGLAIGILGALALARLLEGMLFGVEPWDTATFVMAPLAFIAVAAGAALIPGRRAARVSPMETLREEG